MIFVSRSILQYKLELLKHFTKHYTSERVANIISKHMRQISSNINNTDLSKTILHNVLDDLEIAYLAAVLGENEVVMLQLERVESRLVVTKQRFEVSL